MTAFTGIAHITLTVSDLAASVGWYRRILQFEPVGAVRLGSPESGRPRQLVRHDGSGLTLALCAPVDHDGRRFDPGRTGLDHLSLAVDGEDALRSWVRRLDELGTPHSPIRDAGYARFVTLEDPDGIAWELWATVVEH